MCFGQCDERDSGAARSRVIDRIIHRDGTRKKKEVKLLLLGAGESGKSTILKQMRLIYCQGYSRSERLEWKPIIFHNIIGALRTINRAMTDMNYNFEIIENNEFMMYILGENELNFEESFPSDYFDPIKAIWHDKGVNAVIKKGNEYALHDNLAYFISNMDRMWATEYVPSDADILRARSRTTGITENLFDLGHLTYRMVDVGGQRSERKKWIHCFEDVHCLLFLVAISGYDQCLAEDRDGNQMREALMLWESITNSRWFTKSAMIIFLNKMDLFMDKLPRRPITNYGFNYSGPQDDYNAASKYFLDIFRAQCRDPTKEIYGHFTNATDTNLIKITMSSVQDMLIKHNLNHLML